MRTSRPTLLAFLLLTGCLDRGDYPSLLPRAFERAGGRAEPTPAPAVDLPASAAVVAHTNTLLAGAQTGQRAFAAELEDTRRIVAQAGPSDSESWIAAQQALSALSASRDATLSASVELDAMTLAGANTGYGPADYAAIRAASERMAALIDGQQAELDRMTATLSPP